MERPDYQSSSQGAGALQQLEKRFVGVSANILTARLRDLEDRGVIQRSVLPPPANCEVYELTAKGRAAQPLVLAMERWSQSFKDAG